MRLVVVIPAYNEIATIARAIERLDASPPGPGPDGRAVERVLVIVDDGSTDGTRDAVRALGGRADVRVELHDRNRGKGAAVRTGLRAALDAGADLILIHDADLEYDPRDHAELLRPLLDGRADAVIGSRFIGQTHRVLYYWHAVANRALTTLSNMATNLNLSDIECCLKAFSRPVGERLRLREDRFGVEPEIVARLSRLRLPDERPGASGRTRPLRVYEVPVSYAGRTYAEGKKIGWRDGLSALRCIVRYGLLGRG